MDNNTRTHAATKEDSQTPATCLVDFWKQSFEDLQTAADTGTKATFGLIMYGLFGAKSLSDLDRCNVGVKISQDVLLYAIGSTILLWLCTFTVIPCLTTFVRGLSHEDLVEKQMKKKLKRSYALLSFVLMTAIVLMCLSIFYFVQVRFGLWTCLGVKVRCLMLFLGYAMCCIVFLFMRQVYQFCTI